MIRYSYFNNKNEFTQTLTKTLTPIHKEYLITINNINKSVCREQSKHILCSKSTLLRLNK